LKSAARVGGGLAVINAGTEVTRGYFDPNASLEESVYMIGSGAVIGGALGGLVGSVNLGLLRSTQKKTAKEIFDFNKAMDVPSQADVTKTMDIRKSDAYGLNGKTDKYLIQLSKRLEDENFGHNQNIEIAHREIEFLKKFEVEGLKDVGQNKGDYIRYPSFSVWKKNLSDLVKRDFVDEEELKLQRQYNEDVAKVLRLTDKSSDFKLNTNQPSKSLYATGVKYNKKGIPVSFNVKSKGFFKKDYKGDKTDWYYDYGTGWQKVSKSEKLELEKSPRSKDKYRTMSTGKEAKYLRGFEKAEQARIKALSKAEEEKIYKLLQDIETKYQKKVANAVEKRKVTSDEIDNIIEKYNLPKNATQFKQARELELKELVEAPVRPYVRNVWLKEGFPFASNAYRVDRQTGKQGVRYKSKDGKIRFMAIPKKELAYMDRFKSLDGDFHRPFFTGDDWREQLTAWTGMSHNRKLMASLEGSQHIQQKRIQTSVDEIKNNHELDTAVKNELYQREIENISGSPNYDESIFTTGAMSWAFKSVVTPLKEILINSGVPKEVKLIFMRLANDNAMLSQMHHLGETTGHSVAVRSAIHSGKVKVLFNEMADIWNKDRLKWIDYQYTNWLRKGKKLISRRAEYDFKQSTMEEFFGRATYKYVSRDKNLTPEEKKVGELIENFFKNDADELVAHEVIGNQEYLKVKLDRQKATLRDKLLIVKDYYKSLEEWNSMTALGRTEAVKKGLKNPTAKPKVQSITNLEKVVIPKMRALIDETEDAFAMALTHKGLLENFFPRYFDFLKIRKDPEGLKQVLREYYNSPDNNISYKRVLEQDKALGTAKVKYEEVAGDMTEAGIEKKVNGTFDAIMAAERDPASVDDFGFFGSGQSKHLRHRKIDIPNHVLVDYIITDPMPAIMGYTNRTMPVLEFRKMFQNRTEDQFFDWIEDTMLRAGVDEKLRQSTRANGQLLYDRIVGKVMVNPDRMDTRIANGLRVMARFSFLGQAGLAAISEFGAIMLNHELRHIRNGLLDFMDSSFYRDLSLKEIQKSGELLDVFKGMVGARAAEDFQANVLTQQFWDGPQHLYFKFNGLGPMTYYLKWFDGIVRGNTIMENVLAVKAKEATPEQVRWLAQYGISPEAALKMADEPFEKGTHGTIFVNTDKWKDKGNIENFRGALSSGVLNTIMMSTPADRPKIMDGMVYVPHRIAKRFGYAEDPRVKGYSRMESGLLALPFQFYTYAFATVNKITMPMATGAAKNRAVAAITMLGLGYLSVKLKTPEWAWDKMDYEDRFFRAFDASGTAALYSDLYYTSMHTINAMGGPDIGMGFINPKFNDTQVGALIGLAGAGPSVAQDYFLALKETVSGDTGKGMKDLLSATGISRFYWFRDSMQELGRTLDQKFD